jgi:alanine dehydrogenase
MSEIAGRMAVLNAAKYIEKQFGGKGILIGGAGDVESANITILGAGVAGTAAAKIALAIGANVTLMDTDDSKLEPFRSHQISQLNLFEFSRGLLREILLETDILIASVLVPGQKPPVLVTRDDIKLMQPGSLVIDLSVDQGGCIETSRPTTFDNPTYLFEGIVHSAVTNLPSAVPFTASRALSGAALPYIMQIAQLGTHEAIALSPEIRSGLALYRGKIVNKDLAALQKQEYYDILELLELNI